MQNFSNWLEDIVKSCHYLRTPKNCVIGCRTIKALFNNFMEKRGEKLKKDKISPEFEYEYGNF